MTDQELTAIRARAAQLTPDNYMPGRRTRYVDFHVHAHADVLALCAEVERLRAERDAALASANGKPELYAALEDVLQEIERLRADYNAEIDEFNAGYDAADSDPSQNPDEAEAAWAATLPEGAKRFDEFQCGWAWKLYLDRREHRVPERPHRARLIQTIVNRDGTR